MPELLVLVSRAPPRSKLKSSTCAPATTAPDISVTRPETTAVSVWANAFDKAAIANTTQRTARSDVGILKLPVRRIDSAHQAKEKYRQFENADIRACSPVGGVWKCVVLT